MLTYKSYSDKIGKIKKGELSLTENVKYFLSEIENKKHLNAFNFVFDEYALSRAVEIESKIKNGKYGKLAGLVVGVKDVLSFKGFSNHMFLKYSKEF